MKNVYRFRFLICRDPTMTMMKNDCHDCRQDARGMHARDCVQIIKRMYLHAHGIQKPYTTRRGVKKEK